MLPQFPTLLINPDSYTLDNILKLVNIINCPTKEDNTIRNYFLENYVHCIRSKIEKKRDKAIENQNSSQKLKKKIEDQRQISSEQIFLKKAKQKNESWKQIAQRLNLEMKTFNRRTQWNYSTYLIFSLLRKLQGTLGYFIGIRLMNRSWQMSDQVFKSIQKSAFFTQKFDELIKKDVESIERIEFAFLRDLILSIKLKQSVQASLKRINYANWFDLKKSQSMDIACIAEDWISFLCKKINKNEQKLRPCIKFYQQRFSLKWVNVKNITSPINSYFQKKLSFLLKHKQQLSETVVNEIEIILLEAIIANKSWLEVRKAIQQFKDSINQIEQQKSKKNCQNLTRCSSRKKSLKTQKSDLSQCFTISSGRLNNSGAYIQTADLDFDQLKIAPQKYKSFQQIPIISIDASKDQSLVPSKKNILDSLKQCVQMRDDWVQYDVQDIPRQSNKSKQPIKLKLNENQQIILSCSSKLLQMLLELRKECFPGIQETILAEFYQQNINSLRNKSTVVMTLIESNPKKLTQIEQNLKTVLSMILAARNTQFIKRQIENEKKKAFSSQTQQEIIVQLKTNMEKEYKQLFQSLNKTTLKNVSKKGN